MSRSRQSEDVVIRIAAMEQYIAALLNDARPGEQNAPLHAAADAVDTQAALPRYREFTAAGVPWLLPDSDIEACMPLPGDLQETAVPSWRLGTLARAGSEVVVVDLAKVVAPGLSFARPGIGLHLAGRPWCLAVAAIGAVQGIDQAQFALRAERGARPWLAGMTRDIPRALLDPDALIRVLLAELQA